ncbi:MAG: ATP-binding cassette domain-containing protein [Eubacteriales bacterium]|nr:ATP-binding cassette domain-containing protein [Eubacteriales bacterium]
MACIDLNGLTKDYGQGHGIFELTFSVEEGETFGFVGINGAGKTTTIRHLMGFLNPESGRATIRGMDCWRESAKIKRLVGYIPGEIAFPDAETGEIFLQRQMEMLGCKDMCPEPRKNMGAVYLCDVPDSLNLYLELRSGCFWSCGRCGTGNVFWGCGAEFHQLFGKSGKLL